MENNFEILSAVHKVASPEFRDRIPNPQEVFNSIMEKGNLAGTDDYQQRATDATQAAVSQTMNALFDPMNDYLYNQFLDVLINRIGMVKIRTAKWENPLAAFKSEKLNYGSTIQEIAAKWVKAHTYDDADETLLKMERPDVQQCFHSVNREERYDITIVDDELRMAFTQEFGLNNLVSQLIQNVFNSDNYDEYRYMLNILAEYENRWGFYKEHLDKAPETEEDGKIFLKKVRQLTGELKFPSTKYNAQIITDIPVFANPDELVLLYTPKTAASISVDVLASLFNVEKAQLQVKTVMVDEFPIPNAFALLTTKDWWVCHDKVYQMTSFYNPKTLARNNFLHHWSVLSASPFVPAILFTTDEGTSFPTFEQKVTGLQVSAEKEIANPGDVVQLYPNLLGTFDGKTGTVAPQSACTYELRYNGDTTLSTRTFVDRLGKVHIQKNAVIGDVLEVVCTTTYRNPSQKDEKVFSQSVFIYIGEKPSPKEIYLKDASGTIDGKNQLGEALTFKKELVGYDDVVEGDVIYKVPRFKVQCNEQIYKDLATVDYTIPVIDAAAKEGIEVKNDAGEVQVMPIKRDLDKESPIVTYFLLSPKMSSSTEVKYGCFIDLMFKTVDRQIPLIEGGYISEKNGTAHPLHIDTQGKPGSLGKGHYNTRIGDRFDLSCQTEPYAEGNLKLFYKNEDMTDYEEFEQGKVYISNAKYIINLMLVDTSQGHIPPTEEYWAAVLFECDEINTKGKAKGKAKSKAKK